MQSTGCLDKNGVPKSSIYPQMNTRCLPLTPELVIFCGLQIWSHQITSHSPTLSHNLEHFWGISNLVTSNQPPFLPYPQT